MSLNFQIGRLGDILISPRPFSLLGLPSRPGEPEASSFIYNDQAHEEGEIAPRKNAAKFLRKADQRT